MMKRFFLLFWVFAFVAATARSVAGQDGQTINLGENETQLRADHFNSSAVVARVPEGTKLYVIDGSRQQFLKVRVTVRGKTHVGWILRAFTDIEFVPEGAEPDREALKDLQRDLTRAGFYAGDIDGRQVAALAGAINRFLFSVGERPTSTLTEVQRAELKAVAQRSALKFSELRRPINPDPAEAVAIQTYLTQLGYRIGPTDGVIGSKSKRAIESYQRSLGGSATGVLTLAQVLQLHRTATIRTSGEFDPRIRATCGTDVACIEREIWAGMNRAYADHKAKRAAEAAADAAAGAKTKARGGPNALQVGLGVLVRLYASQPPVSAASLDQDRMCENQKKACFAGCAGYSEKGSFLEASPAWQCRSQCRSISCY